MNKKTALLIGLTINTMIFIFEIIGLIMSAQAMQWGFFQFYTQDSNIIAMLACGIMAVFQIKCLCGKHKCIPKIVSVFKYISVCMLAVTFLVVIFVLAPTAGNLHGYTNMLFGGTMLYHHFLCPILAFISFVFFENENKIIRSHVFLALIPTLLYAVITTTLNIAGLMRGPYPFLLVREQPVYMSVIWFAVILGGAWMIASLIRLTVNKMASK